ncbi:lysine-2,3-aminomutase-like protein [Aliiroseovarius sp. CAU 1755]
MSEDLAQRKPRAAQSLRDLQELGLIDSDITPELQAVADKYAIALTPHIIETIRAHGPNSAIARQYLPTHEELNVTEGELEDPIGDLAHSPIPGIVHRYQDRVLLNLIKTCAVYCRFCFRRETVGPGTRGLDSAQIEAALRYIRQNSQIWEVILSGGDPLTLSNRRLSSVLGELGKIDHIAVARFHTRVPAVTPERITDDLISALHSGPTTYIVMHINHPDELTARVKDAIAMLTENGVPVLGQTVLLRTINNSAETLGLLFKELVKARVKPYYLHHPDLAIGTQHFRVSIQEGQRIFAELRQKNSGLTLPQYVLDLPGGHGKVPISSSYIETKSGSQYQIKDPRGHSHSYTDT